MTFWVLFEKNITWRKFTLNFIIDHAHIECFEFYYFYDYKNDFIIEIII